MKLWTMTLVMLVGGVAVAQGPVSAAPDTSALCVALALDLNETLAQVPGEAGSEVARAQAQLLNARVLRLSALGVFLQCSEGRKPYAKLNYTLPSAAQGDYEKVLTRLVAAARAQKPLSPPTPRTCRWLFIGYSTSEGGARDAVVALHARMRCPATADTMPAFQDVAEWPEAS